MAILIVEQAGTKRGAVLRDRVLVGRRSMNHLLIEHPAVSRMHAWIERWERFFVITDLRSRTGTKVNGKSIGKYHPLADGDVIEIGPAKLTFLAADRVPLDVEAFAIPAEPAVAARDAGIRFDCPTCRAPMWAAAEFAGLEGVCVYCGHAFDIPAAVDAAAAAKPPARPPPRPRTEVVAEVEARLETLQAKPGPTAPPPATTEFPPTTDPGGGGQLVASGRLAPATPSAIAVSARPATGNAATAAVVPAPLKRSPVAAPAAKHVATHPTCGVCHSPILPKEARAACPACGLRFHAECWQENYGCSAYGCSQVNALKPPDPEPSVVSAAADESIVAGDDDVPPAPRTPWEFLLLAVSVLALLASAVSFGATSLAVLVAAVIYQRRTRGDPDRKAGAIYGAMAFAVVGLPAGLVASYLLFVGKR